MLHICTVVKKKLQRGEGRPRSTRHIRYGSCCPTKSASLLASAGSGTQRRCDVRVVGCQGCTPGDTGAKIRLYSKDTGLLSSCTRLMQGLEGLATSFALG